MLSSFSPLLFLPCSFQWPYEHHVFLWKERGQYEHFSWIACLQRWETHWFPQMGDLYRPMLVPFVGALSQPHIATTPWHALTSLAHSAWGSTCHEHTTHFNWYSLKKWHLAIEEEGENETEIYTLPISLCWDMSLIHCWKAFIMFSIGLHSSQMDPHCRQTPQHLTFCLSHCKSASLPNGQY